MAKTALNSHHTAITYLDRVVFATTGTQPENVARSNPEGKTFAAIGRCACAGKRSTLPCLWSPQSTGEEAIVFRKASHCIET